MMNIESATEVIQAIINEDAEFTRESLKNDLDYMRDLSYGFDVLWGSGAIVTGIEIDDSHANSFYVETDYGRFEMNFDSNDKLEYLEESEEEEE